MKKKLNLIPITQIIEKKEVPKHVATYDPRYGKITLSKEYVTDMGYADQFVTILIDAKNKVIGWRKVPSGTTVTSGDEFKQVRKYGGAWMLLVPKKKVAEALGLKEGQKVAKKSVIQSHTEALYGRVDYIEIEEEPNNE